MKPPIPCPVCGTPTTAATCCGIAVAGPFRMSRARVKALRAFAHGRKGLSQETYRLNLQAVGVHSTLELRRDSYNALLDKLRRLPDMPKQGRAAP